MRIIYLHPHFSSHGGAGRMVLETGRRLVARGHQVDCVCIRADNEIVGSDTGIAFHELGGPLSSSLLFWLRFRKSCARACEIVKQIANKSPGKCVLFPQVFPVNWWGSYTLKRLAQLPCIWYCQEPSAFIHSTNWINALPWPKNWIAKALNPILRTYDLQQCRCFKRVLVNSQYSQKQTRSVYSYGESACEVVYLGFDQQKFCPSSVIPRESLIVCVAKLTRFKNVDRIIEAMRLLQVQGDLTTQLHIVGTGDAMSSLQQQTARLGLSDRVFFHGRLADAELVQLLQRARALCLASVDEPFGLVAIEAMACGTPVIAVNSGGPAEVIGDTDSGILISRPNAAEIAEAIWKLSDDVVQFSLRSQAALDRAAHFGWDQTVDSLEKIFQATLSDVSPARPWILNAK